VNWYLQALKKYAEFDGRARRAEYWWFTIPTVLIDLALTSIDRLIASLQEAYIIGLLGLLFGLAMFLPSLAVTFRRLHDIGRTGWWFLIGFLPCVGWIILLIFTLQDSQPSTNQYGPNPKDS
jgi:uncharacterized membrane protein YhaH (DUF805 family)